jgi:16S rRNA (guanine527-N7)-methyltransferase
MSGEAAGGGERLQRLAGLHGLGPAQLAQLGVVLRALKDDEHAPTAVRDEQQAIDTHIADSLSALGLDVLAGAASIADLGTGAGFPGLPLAIALPDAEVRLLDSRRRSCEFLARVCAEAEVDNARVVWARAEEWREGLADNDAVLARALAAQPVVLEYAAPLLRAGGTLVDWRGAREPEAERAALAAAAELGLRRTDVVRVEPFAGARNHHLHLYLKVRDTPERFPRRAGMARKRPLGSGAGDASDRDRR